MFPARPGLPILAAYAVPGLPLAVLTLPVFIYLPTFYGSELGLGLAATGAILLLARLFDVVTDPLTGHWCDRIGLRAGRRRVWMLAATPLVALAAWQLFLPPEGAGLGHLLAWTLLLYLGWTALWLPYQAWGAELSGDYHQRSRIAGARETLVLAGTCLAAAMPALAAWLGQAEGASLARPLAWAGWLVICLLPPAVLLAALVVPEPPPLSSHPAGFRQGLRLMRRNGPFLRLLGAYLANGTANGLAATLFLLFVEHRLAAPEYSGALLLAYFLAGILSVPAWLAVSRHLGKHRAWALGMALACLGFLAVPLLGPGDIVAFLLVCIATGLCLGADLALPGAIQADVVDLDTLRGGGQRTGAYFAAWSMATKLALAIAVGLAFPLLELAGFDPAADTGGDGLLALALLYGLLPIPIKITAIALVWRFPLDQARQARLRRIILRRAAGADSR